MSDSRPADDLTTAIANLRRDYDDKIATLLQRVSRRPVGTIEPTLRSTAPPFTVLLNGGTYFRADVPDLWAWANDVGAVTGGLFGVGDGSTTFTVPSFRGRVPIGVGTLSGFTYALGDTGGEAEHVLSIAELASHGHDSATTAGGGHSHGGATGDDGAHTHSGTAASGGGHSGHTNVTDSTLDGTGTLVTVRQGNVTLGDHTHSLSIGSDPGHWHAIDAEAHHTHGINAQGSNEAHENRPPYIAINWCIYY